jgi:hypothetical protein
MVVPIIGRHRGFDSIMGADRVHQIVDHLTLIARREPSAKRLGR